MHPNRALRFEFQAGSRRVETCGRPCDNSKWLVGQVASWLSKLDPLRPAQAAVLRTFVPGAFQGLVSSEKPRKAPTSRRFGGETGRKPLLSVPRLNLLASSDGLRAIEELRPEVREKVARLVVESTAQRRVVSDTTLKFRHEASF